MTISTFLSLGLVLAQVRVLFLILLSMVHKFMLDGRQGNAFEKGSG